MHKDLRECIETARSARNGVLDKSLSVQEANAVANNNHTIIMAYALELRTRIFLADPTGTGADRLLADTSQSRRRTPNAEPEEARA